MIAANRNLYSLTSSLDPVFSTTLLTNLGVMMIVYQQSPSSLMKVKKLTPTRNYQLRMMTFLCRQLMSHQDPSMIPHLGRGMEMSTKYRVHRQAPFRHHRNGANASSIVCRSLRWGVKKYGHQRSQDHCS
jgi:hypothetical protein